jgi:uncharacterized protein (TIGR02145 family)
MSKTLQQQLADKMLKQYPTATIKKIDKDNYLDIHIPAISEKIGTHFTFSTTRNGIKLSVYSKDDVLCEQFLENSSELEPATRGVRLKDNPIYDTVKKAIEAALFFIGELTESKKAPAIKKAVPATKKLVLKKAVPKKAVPKNTTPKKDSLQNVPEEKQLKKLAKPVSEFKSVKIGKQIWMSENLNVVTFRNGDKIPEAKSDKEWAEAGKNKKPAMCYMDNDKNNGKKYGILYNWYAVNDPRGLAPEGWRIPNEDEWEQLIVFLGGKDIAGNKMKFTRGWSEWDDEDGELFSGNGTNESGFSGMPGGSRADFGTFNYVGDHAGWWSSIDCNATDALSLIIYNYFESIKYSEDIKSYGFSARCINK